MISTIDLGIIGVYFLAVIIIGLIVAVKTKSGDDLFLGGRSLTWGFIGLSLFASNISSTTLIGLAGAAYTTGLAQSVYEWGAGLAFIVLAAIFVPLYLSTRMTTCPEFLERRYDRRSRMFFSAITIVTSIVVDTAGGLYAGAIVLQTFFPDLILWQTCFVLALVAGTYTAFGGLKAVVYTDALQAVILILGCGALTFIMFSKIGFSWDAMVSAAPEGHFSFVKPIDDPDMPWPGIILGVPFLGIWYVATNQYVTQRILGAKSIRHARWGVMLASYLKLLPFFIMVLPGAMAISLLPGLSNSDMVFPSMVLEFLPVGLVGLVLAGLISAIMSSVDSTLNSASTLVVVDFVSSKHPEMTPKQVAFYGRTTTFILMVLAALWAPMIVNFGGLWAYLQQMFSIIVPPIIVVFLVGVLYPRGNGVAAIWTLILGTALGVCLFVLDLNGLWPIHYLMNVGFVIAVCTLLFVVLSHLTGPPKKEAVEKYTFRKDMLNLDNEGLSWYQDYRYHSAAILGIMLIFAYKLW